MVWLAAMPFRSEIQRATLERFHLATPSYPAWATLQIIPPMYNLENQYRYSIPVERELNGLPGSQESSRIGLTSYSEKGYVNHFPARLITFFDNRARLLSQSPEAILRIESRYQAEKMVTTWIVERDSRGVTHMRRTSSSGEIP